MPPATTPEETCPQTTREQRDAAFHLRYLGYIVRFHRLERLKGWARYTLRHPLDSLASMTSRSGLPGEWCRQPLSEADWLAEVFLAHLKNLPD